MQKKPSNEKVWFEKYDDSLSESVLSSPNLTSNQHLIVIIFLP